MLVFQKYGVFIHALLSGCDGGNGVYSFFTDFFFGSRRLARFLWRNLGRKRSQLCDRSSGSLASSRLIISVCGAGGAKPKKRGMIINLIPGFGFMSPPPLCPQLQVVQTSAYGPREADSQSRGREQGWKTSSWGMNLMILVQPLPFFSSYLYIIDGMDVLHCVHHNFAYLNRREKGW